MKESDAVGDIRAKGLRFVVNSKGKKTAVIVPIKEYERLLELAAKPPQKFRVVQVPRYRFHMKHTGKTAFCYGNGAYRIEEGSEVKRMTSSFRSDCSTYFYKRVLLEEDGTIKDRVFTRDALVFSLSEGASIVAGNSRDGLLAWKEYGTREIEVEIPTGEGDQDV